MTDRTELARDDTQKGYIRPVVYIQTSGIGAEYEILFRCVEAGKLNPSGVPQRQIDRWRKLRTLTQPVMPECIHYHCSSNGSARLSSCFASGLVWLYLPAYVVQLLFSDNGATAALPVGNPAKVWQENYMTVQVIRT